MSEYIKVCETAARSGGAVLQDWAGRFSVREKGPADLVTEADLASQDAVRKIVLDAFPDHAFQAEEGATAIPEGAKFRWIVDPLDGTSNYVHGVPHFAVSVALESEGQLLAGTVFDPVARECFTAAKGEGAFLNGKRLRVSEVTDLAGAMISASLPARVQRDGDEIPAFLELLLAAQAIRRMGSAALNLCYLAAGRFDGCWATDTKAWDVAAGFLIVLEAGGVVTGLNGEPFDLDHPRFLAAANSSLRDQMQVAIAAFRSG